MALTATQQILHDQRRKNARVAAVVEAFAACGDEWPAAYAAITQIVEERVETATPTRRKTHRKPEPTKKVGAEKFTAAAVRVLTENADGMTTVEVSRAIGQDPKGVHSTLRWLVKKSLVARRQDGRWVATKGNGKPLTVRRAIENVAAASAEPIATRTIFERAQVVMPDVTIEQVQPEVSRLVKLGVLVKLGGPGRNDWRYALAATNGARGGLQAAS